MGFSVRVHSTDCESLRSEYVSSLQVIFSVLFQSLVQKLLWSVMSIRWGTVSDIQ